MRRSLSLFPAALLLLAPPGLRGQDGPEEPKSGGWTLYVDQDSFVRPSSDKDYTMGVLFQKSGAFASGKLRKPLDGFDWVSRFGKAHVSLKARGGVEAHSLEVGIAAFTPRKGDPSVDTDCERRGCILERTDPVYNDRPYASILYGAVRRTTARNRLAVKSDLTVGILGLGLAEAGQTWIHKNLTHDVRPGGWPHQISDGFEPTAKYQMGVQYLLVDGSFCKEKPGPPTDCPPDKAVSSDYDELDDRWLDVTVDSEVNLGYYTNFAAGVRARFGFIDSPYWATDRRPVSTTRVPPGHAKRPRVSELYVFGSFGGEAWAYNALLQGQVSHSDVRLKFHPPADDPNALAPLNRFVWDSQFGLTARFRRFIATYQYNVHSALFDGPYSRKHRWGGVYFGVVNNRGAQSN